MEFLKYIFSWGNKWKKFVAKKTNKGETNPAGATPHSQTKLHFLGIWEDHYYTLPSSLSQRASYGHPVKLSQYP
jgi:hypothetical protein